MTHIYDYFAYDMIFVDDCSTDKTWEIIKRLKIQTPQLRAIKFRRNYGQTNAMVEGFDHASGEIIITMDGDLQNDPEYIPMLWFAFFGFLFCFIGLGLGITSVFLFLQGERSIVYPAASFLLLSLFGSLLSWGLLAEFFVKIEKNVFFT